MPTDFNTVRELIQITSAYLEKKGIESARLNAERLLSHVLGLSRIELYLQHDRPVLGEELDQYRECVRRRSTGEPLQTLIGTTEFYSRNFRVDTGVFIPRPETERLVEIATGLLTPTDRRLIAPVVIEIGCGAGVIAVSLAVEIPQLEVWGTDINPAAITVSEHNARLQGVGARTHFLQGDRFSPLPDSLRGHADLLVSNPPYIRQAELATLPAEVQRDPAAALDGGEDGLIFYRALAAKMALWLRPGGWIALEIGADQDEDVAEILRASGGWDINLTRDYNDLPRVVTARCPLADPEHQQETRLG